MAWKQVNGRWVKDGAAAPAGTPAAMNGLTAEFARQPLNFMKKHPLQPANGKLAGGATVLEWALDPNQIIGMTGAADDPQLTNPLYRTNRHTGAKQLTGQRINMTGAPKYASFMNAGSYYSPKGTTKEITVSARTGEVVLVITDGPDDTGHRGVPIWWLPWGSYKIAEFQIPPVPTNLVEVPEDEFPRFFLTASINGCSVFARGDATAPTVFHAGIEDKIRSGDAEGFWKRQLAMAQAGYDTAAISGAVHKDEYMQLNANHPEARAAKNYLDWLKEGETDGRPLTIDVTTGYGCVFGVRYGRFWTLYLQEILNLRSVKLYKRSDLKSTATGYAAPGNVPVQRTVTKTPGKFFGTKTSKVYSSTQNIAVPMKVVEFYPNRNWAGSLGGQKVALSKV